MIIKFIHKCIAGTIFFLFVKSEVQDIAKSIVEAGKEWNINEVNGRWCMYHEAGRVLIDLPPNNPGFALFIDGEEINLSTVAQAALLRAVKTYADQRRKQAVENLLNDLRKGFAE